MAIGLRATECAAHYYHDGYSPPLALAQWRDRVFSVKKKKLQLGIQSVVVIAPHWQYFTIFWRARLSLSSEMLRTGSK